MTSIAPRLFALTRQCDEARKIVGFGMVLPDGSAYSVSWPTPGGAPLCSSDSAEDCARLREADLEWIGDQR